MSIENIEREYENISSKISELNDALDRLIEIVNEIKKYINNNVISNKKLIEKTQNLLKEMESESRGELDREKVNRYLMDVKNLLKEIKETESASEKEDYSELKEDLNIIDQILSEELPEPPMAFIQEEKIKEEEIQKEAPLSEIESLKDYVKKLSDQLFDLGEEILDLKERVLKLEKIIYNEKTITHPAPPKYQEETPKEYIKFKKLIEEAKSVLSEKTKNVLIKAIKVEALKARFERNLSEAEGMPNLIKNEFSKQFDLLVNEANKLKTRILKS